MHTVVQTSHQAGGTGFQLCERSIGPLENGGGIGFVVRILFLSHYHPWQSIHVIHCIVVFVFVVIIIIVLSIVAVAGLCDGTEEVMIG